MNTSMTKSEITLEAAKFLVDQAVQHAKTLPLKISVTVLDAGGNLKAFQSMDGAPLVSVEASLKKAKTAVGFGLPTGQTWYQFIKDDPILMNGAAHLPDFILLGGGAPIIAAGNLIGAIGISGGHYAQDEKCIKAAIDALKAIDPTIQG
jgi:uncharacterized protein GlcG (DUF336 family)